MSLELEVAVASGIIIPVIAILVTVFLAYKPEKIPFKLIRRDSQVKEPFESNIAIEVSHPDKTIEKCKVIYDGLELVSEESNSPYVTIFAQGSALFHIPLNKENEEAVVIVKNGRHTLRKEKLKNLERRKPIQVSTGKRGFFYSSTGQGFP